MKRTILLLAFAACSFSVFAQGELPVDMNTGRPIINTPLATITSHEISDNVYLSYNASGVRVQQPSGNYGTGWNLSAGGSIRRETRGLPDDFTGTSTDARRGWLFTNTSGVMMASEIGTVFQNSSDVSTSTFTDESSDYGKLNSYSYNYDTEPDVIDILVDPEAFDANSDEFIQAVDAHEKGHVDQLKDIITNQLHAEQVFDGLEGDEEERVYREFYEQAKDMYKSQVNAEDNASERGKDYLPPDLWYLFNQRPVWPKNPKWPLKEKK